MLKMPRKMAVLGAMLAALLITGAALAQQTPPHTFYGRDGDVTIDGDKAPSGTTIAATAAGENVGMATVGDDDSWSIDVAGGTKGVTFTVNGIAAEGSYDAPQGQNTRLTLAVTATPDPHTFSGTATLDGAPATGSAAPADPDSLEGESGADDVTGAAIAAMAEGQDSVSATSDPSDGSWSLEVPGDTSGWTFTVNGEAAGEGPYEAVAGGSTTVALALVSPPPAPHTFSGTATVDGEANAADIVATAEGQDAVSATADMDGSWSLKVPGDTSGWTFTANGTPVGGGPYAAPAGETTPDIALPLVTVHTFSGTATVDGDPAAGGLIVAMVGDDTVGTATADEGGAWSLTVDGGQPGLTFMVNRLMADAGPYEAVAGGETANVELAVTTPTEEPATDGDDAMTDGDDAMTDGDDAMTDGDDAMTDGDDAMTDGDDVMMDGDSGFPDTGTGGLADTSRGVSSAVYGGIAGALALIALAGGVAVRRRAQS